MIIYAYFLFFVIVFHAETIFVSKVSSIGIYCPTDCANAISEIIISAETISNPFATIEVRTPLIGRIKINLIVCDKKCSVFTNKLTCLACFFIDDGVTSTFPTKHSHILTYIIGILEISLIHSFYVLFVVIILFPKIIHILSI